LVEELEKNTERSKTIRFTGVWVEGVNLKKKKVTPRVQKEKARGERVGVGNKFQQAFGGDELQRGPIWVRKRKDLLRRI